MIEVFGLVLQTAGVVTVLFVLLSRRKQSAVTSRDRMSRLIKGSIQTGKRLKFLIGGLIWYSLLVVGYSGIILPADVRMQTPIVSPNIWQALAEAGISLALVFPVTVALTALVLANTHIPLTHEYACLQPRKILLAITESSVAAVVHVLGLFVVIAPLFVLVSNLFRIDEIGLRIALGPLFVCVGMLGVLAILVLLFNARGAENRRRLRPAAIFAYHYLKPLTGELVLQAGLRIFRYFSVLWEFTLDHIQQRIRIVLVFASLTFLVGLLLELSNRLLTR